MKDSRTRHIDYASTAGTFYETMNEIKKDVEPTESQKRYFRHLCARANDAGLETGVGFGLADKASYCRAIDILKKRLVDAGAMDPCNYSRSIKPGGPALVDRPRVSPIFTRKPYS